MKFTVEIESDDPEFNWKEEVATILQGLVTKSSHGLHYQFNEPFGFKGGLFDSKGDFVGEAIFDTGETPESDYQKRQAVEEGRIKCPSGLMGWTSTLRENYDSDFESFEAYCEMYSLHKRLGFETPEDAWEANPQIMGSTNPDDFQVVPKN